MPIDFQMWLMFGGVWVVLRLFDMAWPPHTPVMNAALAMMAALCLFARHIEKSR